MYLHQALLFGSVYTKNPESLILATENVLEGIVDSVVLYSLSFATCHNQKQLQLVIVITFYSPSCLGQEIAKGPCGLQAATCPPVYHTRRRLGTVPLIADRQAGKLRIPIFIVFGLT